MTTRCKVTVGNFERGKNGNSCSFNAVYEGSSALAAVSENAKFGWASPSLYVTLVGSVPEIFDPPRHTGRIYDEEYYIDITEALASDPDVLFQVPCRKRFQNCGAGSNMTSFQIVVDHPDTSGTMSLGVVNPPAVEWLDKFERGYFVFRLARGRRSDAEIAAREAEIESQIKNFDGYRKYETPEARATALEAHLYSYRRKLARAKGEDPESVPVPA